MNNFMDMKRIRRPHQPLQMAGHDAERGPAAVEGRAVGGVLTPGGGILRPLFLVLACFSIALLVIAFSGSLQTTGPLRKLRFFSTPQKIEEEGSFVSPDAKRDRLLLDGLLASGDEDQSCLSRYKLGLLRKQSPYMPSPYLLQRLRKQEALQKKCGPGTESYDQAIEQLKSGRASGNAECKYVVWSLDGGLGNRILSLVSTFLLALLTNRALLIERGADTSDLFCEPFPETSWLLPLDFPVHFERFDSNSSHSYGNMLKNKVITDQFHKNGMGRSPSYAYIYLMHDYDDFDKLFFCEDDQRVLHNIPWLLLNSNNYFVPSLFLVPVYEEELAKLFPQKDTVFHHLGRYLLHPSNTVWGLITRYYQSYLANYDQRVGIQIRVFDGRQGEFVLDQILACTMKEKLLPEINVQKPATSSANISLKSVIITSLTARYSDQIRNMYWEYPASTGEIISVHQPSHEEIQLTKEKLHDSKGLSEIYLLSLTDELVTSAWSTFGYVAQALGGLKPWILVKPDPASDKAPDPPCGRAMSMEPCFHAAPFYDCKAKRGTDTGALVPHVRHCEDMSWGLKLTDGTQD